MNQGPKEEQEFTAEQPEPGKFLKEEDQTTGVEASKVYDESDGMQETDFLGKSNLRNRNVESKEDK